MNFETLCQPRGGNMSLAVCFNARKEIVFVASATIEFDERIINRR
jgi:hypothetical protein